MIIFFINFGSIYDELNQFGIHFFCFHDIEAKNIKMKEIQDSKCSFGRMDCLSLCSKSGSIASKVLTMILVF